MSAAIAPAFELRDARARAIEVRAMRWTTVFLMLLGVVSAIAALAFWDERRESNSALEEFREDQATLAASVAADLSTRLARARRDALVYAEASAEKQPASSVIATDYVTLAIHATPPPPPVALGPSDPFRLLVPVADGRTVELGLMPAALIGGVGQIARPESRVVLVSPPDRPDLLASDGRAFRQDRLLRAVAEGRTSLDLSREEAAAFGLPHRAGVAGLARVDAGTLGHWAIAVVATAKRERDREQRARLRLVLGVAVAATMVSAFGVVLLRRQRRELLLERELEIAALRAEGDERLARASKAATMGTLTSGIAHEISTPLAVIAGRAEQLMRRADDDRTRRQAETIVEQADRIGEIIRRFIDLSRGVKPRLEPVSPSAIVEAAVALVGHRFDAAEVALVVEVTDDLPQVQGDARLLEHVLVNLLLNACEASPRRARVVVSGEADATHVRVLVRDDGAGISPTDAARATEPFFTTKREGESMGLGLAVASEIVKEHHGTLRLEARRPRGTVAIVQLPRA